MTVNRANNIFALNVQKEPAAQNEMRRPWARECKGELAIAIGKAFLNPE